MIRLKFKANGLMKWHAFYAFTFWVENNAIFGSFQLLFAILGMLFLKAGTWNVENWMENMETPESFGHDTT